MKKALLICGSLNQTTMMHQISKHLKKNFVCFFTPFYTDGILDRFSRWGWLDFTILGNKQRRDCLAYLQAEKLSIDQRGSQQDYDLVVSGTDILVQKNIRDKRFVLVQEGMMEAETWVFPLVKNLGLPRFLANTAATGLSDAYDVFCVASPGYRQEFIRKGVKPEKIFVTGIPNFDDVETFRQNNFPYHGYVLAATSPLRETFRFDNRKAFLHRLKEIAAGRQVIIKLHPLENVDRACREVAAILPGAMVLAEGNTEHLVANCSVLVTQISSVTFIGMALGKEVHTDLDLSELAKLLPIQNKGKSASRIAAICHQVMQTPKVGHKSIKGNLPSSKAEVSR